MIKIPPSLKAGDMIGLVCPAGYMNAERVQACIETLAAWGYKVKLGKTVGGSSTTYFSGTDDERLQDLQEMLDDREIAAIMCARGGYGTGRIIDRLDFSTFKHHPKWIIGYSDITVLHSHIYSNYGIATLHAPMAGAFNDDGAGSMYVLSLKNALEGGSADYDCAPHANNREGKGKGELVGGNLALLAHAVGTPSDIKTKNKILFIEDIGEYVYNIDRMFYQLKRSGKLDKLSGLIIGHFSDTKDTERPFGREVYDLINDLVAEYDYPVCFNFPVSHDPENYALKIGVKYKLEVRGDGVRLKE